MPLHISVPHVRSKALDFAPESSIARQYLLAKYYCHGNTGNKIVSLDSIVLFMAL